MKKSLIDKKVNKNIKKLNKQISQDVFGKRFEARQIKKAHYYDVGFYQYELIDHEYPEREKVLPWMNGIEIIDFNSVWQEMNRFIVTSDFWNKYYNKTK